MRFCEQLGAFSILYGVMALSYESAALPYSSNKVKSPIFRYAIQISFSLDKPPSTERISMYFEYKLIIEKHVSLRLILAVVLGSEFLKTNDFVNASA